MDYDEIIKQLDEKLATRPQNEVISTSLQLAINCLLAAKYAEINSQSPVVNSTHTLGYDHRFASEWLSALDRWLAR